MTRRRVARRRTAHSGNPHRIARDQRVGRVGVALGGAALSLLVAASCSATTTPAAAPTTTGTGPGTTALPVGSVPGSRPTGTARPSSGDGSASIDLGGGRTIHLECRGTGSPTVVLVSGAGMAADNWSFAGSAADDADAAKPSDAAVLPQLARSHRVCAYDRPGTQQMDGSPGRSTEVAQPTTAPGDAADLHALLTAADITGPLVLVGHSWGGFVALTYARTHPDEVVGLVLVDPGSPNLQAALPPAVWDQWMQTIAASIGKGDGSEVPDYPTSLASFAALGPMPDIPVVVLTADHPFDYLGVGDGDTHWSAWLDAGAALAASLHATHVTRTDSGHFIQLENAPLVVQQVCAVLATTGPCPAS
jgi:pimeloyl-ACP methyl ester carboxylesterase